MNKLHFPFCKIFFKIEEKDATKKGKKKEIRMEKRKQSVRRKR